MKDDRVHLVDGSQILLHVITAHCGLSVVVGVLVRFAIVDWPIVDRAHVYDTVGRVAVVDLARIEGPTVIGFYDHVSVVEHTIGDVTFLHGTVVERT